MVKGEEDEVPGVAWDLDNAYRQIGPRGKFQMLTYLMHGLMYVTLAWHFTGFVFIVDTPPFHCKIPETALKNETIPKVLVDGMWKDDGCNMYTNFSVSNDTIPCPDGPAFDPNSGYISTIVTDFELVCGSNILVEVSMMISNAAMAIFQVIANKFVDIYGRKKIFILSVFGRCIAGVAKAFSPNMTAYMIFDVIMYISQTGFASTLIIMTHELFPPEFRSFAATTLEFFWLTSLLLTTLMVFCIRNWRHLQLAYSVPLLVGVLYIWFIPESLPWLMAQKRYKDAQRIIERGGRINKRPAPPEFFLTGKIQTELNGIQPELPSTEEKPARPASADVKEYVDTDTSYTGSISRLTGFIGSQTSIGIGPGVWVLRDSIKEEEEEAGHALVETQPTEGQATVAEVFKSGKMRIYSAIFFLLWFTNSIVYSGLNLTVTYLSGDRYMNFFLYAIAEVPAIVGFHWALNRFGRRYPLCFFHLVAGVAMLFTLLDFAGVESRQLSMALNFIGKFGITASYCCILVFSPEIYPTSVRSLFFGMCFFWALVANLVAPYCRPLERAIPGIVRGICGALSVIGGLLALLLPETFRRPLPKTVAEVEAWPRAVTKQEILHYNQLRKESKQRKS